MEVHLDAEVEAKLARIAAEHGRDPELLAREAVERFVNYDEWFLREVEKGLAQVENDSTLSHDDVAGRIEKRIHERQSNQ